MTTTPQHPGIRKLDTAPLRFTYHRGAYYLTTASLAEHFGLSLEITRRRLRDDGLMGLSTRLANTPLFPVVTWALLKLSLAERTAGQDATVRQLDLAARYMTKQLERWTTELARLNAVN